MLTSLADKVWLVSPPGPPRYPYGNCMFIDDEVPTVIDLGAGRRSFQEIAEKTRQVLLSHFHFDHTHSSSLFPAARILVGHEEYPTYVDEKEYVRFHGYDLWEQMMPGIKRELYGQVVPLPDDVPARPGFRPLPIAGTFADREIISLGKRKITALHLPGHTAGHYGFYLEQEGILFSGDIDLAPAGPWYSSNSADVGDLIRSVQRIKEISPAVLVPSHRRVLTEGISEGLDRYISIVLEREARIYDLLATPMTICQLSEYRLVFPDQINTYEVFWERMTIRNHLRHLLQQGLIREVEKGVFQRT